MRYVSFLCRNTEIRKNVFDVFCNNCGDPVFFKEGAPFVSQETQESPNGEHCQSPKGSSAALAC